MGVGGLNVASLVLSLAASVLLARGLGPEGFGKYAFILSVVTVLSLPLDQGMRQLITREVSRYRQGEDWARFRGLMRWAHQWVLLGAFLIVAVLGSLALYHAAWNVNDRWTLVLVGLVLVPCLGLNALRGANLRGLGHVVFAQLPELLVRPGFHLAVAACLLILGLLNPATALLSQVAAAACAFLLGAYLLHYRRPPQLAAAAAAYEGTAWTRAWLPFTLLMGVSLLNGQLGILLLGWLDTDEQVAAFRVADSGARLVAMSLVVVNAVIAPHITRLYQERNWPGLQQLSRRSARAALAVALPIGFLLIFLGTPIVAFVFGRDYVDLAVTPLAILAMGQLFNVAFGSVGMLLNMSGFERYSLYGLVVALSMNAVAAVVLVPVFGAVGAACAAAIGVMTANVIHAFNVMRHLELRPTAL